MLAMLACQMPAYAQGSDSVNGIGQPQEMVPSGKLQGSFSNATTNVANTSTTITLDKAARHVVIKTDPAAAVIYVDLDNGTATSADFRIDPGAGFMYEGKPITTFKYIGASAAGTISVAAW